MKNKGIIKINNKLVDDLDQKVLDEAFRDIFVAAIENNDHGVLTYYCYSDLFDEVKEGDEIPEYEIELTLDRRINNFSRQVKKVKIHSK